MQCMRCHGILSPGMINCPYCGFEVIVRKSPWVNRASRVAALIGLVLAVGIGGAIYINVYFANETTADQQARADAYHQRGIDEAKSSAPIVPADPGPLPPGSQTVAQFLAYAKPGTPLRDVENRYGPSNDPDLNYWKCSDGDVLITLYEIPRPRYYPNAMGGPRYEGYEEEIYVASAAGRTSR
jgi:DNA-directed RNA polymerase subunit RPC12/RpoP